MSKCPAGGLVLIQGAFAMVFTVVTLLSLQSVAVRAVTPDEMLADPALEARAREISQGLRCVVCPNQSIDDSNAPLAKDLRVLVRERLQAGDSNAEAKAFIVARYGNFVLLKPPIQLNTVLLWFAPALLAIIVLFGLVRFLRRQQSLSPSGSGDAALATAMEELTAEEAERLREIVKKGATS